MDLDAFPCMPPCIQCRQTGICNKPVASFAPGETVKTRERGDPYAGTVILPCGCWGLPWPLVHKLGTNFEEILCDKHGWLKITKTAKKKMKTDADRLMKNHIAQKEVLFLCMTRYLMMNLRNCHTRMLSNYSPELY